MTDQVQTQTEEQDDNGFDLSESTIALAGSGFDQAAAVVVNAVMTDFAASGSTMGEEALATSILATVLNAAVNGAIHAGVKVNGNIYCDASNIVRDTYQPEAAGIRALLNAFGLDEASLLSNKQ